MARPSWTITNNSTEQVEVAADGTNSDVKSLDKMVGVERKFKVYLSTPVDAIYLDTGETRYCIGPKEIDGLEDDSFVFGEYFVPLDEKRYFTFSIDLRNRTITAHVTDGNSKPIFIANEAQSCLSDLRPSGDQDP